MSGMRQPLGTDVSLWTAGLAVVVISGPALAFLALLASIPLAAWGWWPSALVAAGALAGMLAAIRRAEDQKAALTWAIWGPWLAVAGVVLVAWLLGVG